MQKIERSRKINSNFNELSGHIKELVNLKYLCLTSLSRYYALMLEI